MQITIRNPNVPGGFETVRFIVDIPEPEVPTEPQPKHEASETNVSSSGPRANKP